MAYRLLPMSAFPATPGKVYPDARRTTSNGFWFEGIGVMAALDADAEIHYVFRVPGGLPVGTAKLSVLGLSHAADGDMKINPKWASKATEEDLDISAASLNAEGVSTLTWTIGSDDHQLKELKVTLDADTIVADEFIVMRLTLETSGWTLDQRAILMCSIIWE